jgi:alcohol dehydrogenase class IV
LIDPLLIRLMSKNITAWSGFDALAHAYESYVSRIQSDYTAALMLRSMKLVAENLREFSYNRMNHKACMNMCLAESLAAVGMQLGSGPGIVHGLAHTLSVLTGYHHGRANAVFTLAGERYNQATCPEKFAEMAKVMGADIKGLTTMQASDKWFDEIDRLLKDLGIQSGNLNAQFGLKREDLGHMVDVYSNDFCSQSNPRGFNREECMALLETLF